jgi:hypothetical protein
VIGAEKHDAGAAYPSYSGLLDELRISDAVRYTADFAPPTAPFAPDASTRALYHFDAGPEGPCTGAVADASGNAGGPSDGVCRYGGGDPGGPVYVSATPFAPVAIPILTPPLAVVLAALLLSAAWTVARYPSKPSKPNEKI